MNEITVGEHPTSRNLFALHCGPVWAGMDPACWEDLIAPEQQGALSALEAAATAGLAGEVGLVFTQRRSGLMTWDYFPIHVRVDNPAAREGEEG